MIKKNQAQWEYFDDCEICQAMKMADKEGHNLSEHDLLAAFKKAKDNGAFVGGEFFDEQGSQE